MPTMWLFLTHTNIYYIHTHTHTPAHLSHLEDVEGFKLDVPGAVSQHGHHQLEVVHVADVACHAGEIVSVQQQLAKQLKTEGRG